MRNREDRFARIGRRAEGFTLIEVMVASFLLLIVFFGLSQFHTRGHRQIVGEDHWRKASGVARSRLERVRRFHRYDDLVNVSAADTTYVLDGRNYVVSHIVATGTPELQSSAVTVTVTWNEELEGGSVPRSLSCSTIISRSLPWTGGT
ncbi:prepilin-type N-terminal cleavage/methylation domain-containing protein [bacterium]|nr:prepilin-type N-terminal cleavage/methylation domain-containing protein [bacterium]